MMLYMMCACICKYVLQLLCTLRSFPWRTLLHLIHLQHRARTGNYRLVTQPDRNIVRMKSRKKGQRKERKRMAKNMKK